MNCVNCRAADMQEQKTDMAAEVKGESVLVQQIDALVCPKCEFKTIKGSQMAEYMRLAADGYRRRHSMLTSDEIRSRRTKLRMSQEQFASYLGVGSASVKRWELGNVQDQAMEELIRIKTSIHEARENYVRVAVLTAPPEILLMANRQITVPVATWHGNLPRYRDWEGSGLPSHLSLQPC